MKNVVPITVAIMSWAALANPLSLPLKRLGLSPVETRTNDTQTYGLHNSLVKDHPSPLPAGVTLQIRKSSYQQPLGTLSENYDVMFGKSRLCVYYFNKHHLPNGTVLQSGLVPPQLASSKLNFDRPNAQDVFRSIKLHTGQKPTDIQVKSSCLWAKETGLYPALVVHAAFGPLAYEYHVTSHGIEYGEQRFFTATGTTEALKTNRTSTETLIESWPMKDSGFLEDDHFFTEPSPEKRHNSDTFTFSAPIDSREIVEINAYAFVNRALAFATNQLGYQWEGARMQVTINKPVGNNTNNALYTPGATTSSTPTIAVGEGDGRLLKNLGYDEDVIAHEFNHHIVYKTLKSTRHFEQRGTVDEYTNHSLALHEGLADYFAFARTGDPCLGESICPGGSKDICYIKNECLRTGDNRLSYTGNDYWNFGSLTHFKGQLISGLLWDIRTSGILPPEDFDRVVYSAVSLLGESATYGNFLSALVEAGKATHGSKACSFIDKMNGRGLQVFSDIPCHQSGNSSGGKIFPLCAASPKKPERGPTIPTVGLLLLPLIFLAQRRRAGKKYTDAA